MNWFLRVAFLFTQVTTLSKEEIHKDRKSLNVKAGDVVKVIAPCSNSSEKVLPFAKTYIESLGLVANISKNIFSEKDPIYSNTDDFRANDLLSALLDDNIKIIWCIRGGTGLGRGSIRLIPYLDDKLPITLKHKIFIGYNDITVLHLYFQYKYSWQTIHVEHILLFLPVNVNLRGLTLDDIATGLIAPSSKSVVSLIDLIFERKNKICFPARKLSAMNVTRIESKVVGGNSATIELSVKTRWQINMKGRILFLEDVGEDGDNIEKRLDYMKQTSIFDEVVAVIFGNFAEANDDWLVELVLDRFAKSVQFPVFRVNGIGHGKNNYPLPLLTNCEISSIDGGLSFEFCVDNIQNTNNGNNGTSNYLSNKFNFLALLIIGFSILIAAH